MHQKQTSQSKALKNLVERIPVKEGQKLSKIELPIEKYSKSENGTFSQARRNQAKKGEKYLILN